MIGTLSSDRALQFTDFRRLASNGFGDGWNSCAHSMAWFRNALYVGTSRATLGMVKQNDPPPSLTPWPIDVPDDLYELDRRAQIWRYDPGAGSWSLAFRSPLLVGRSRGTVPRDIGYRGMSVARIHGDAWLYVCAWAPSRGREPVILRTKDGVHFDTLSAPAWEESHINTFRALVYHRGRLFTAPTGRTTGYGQADETGADLPVLFTAEGPDLLDWAPACSPGFGDLSNITLFEIASYNGNLVVGTLNPTTGFQLWRTTSDRLPYSWKVLIRDGADRGPINELCVSMAVFRGRLYVGTGIVSGGFDRRRGIGPAAPEIIPR